MTHSTQVLHAALVVWVVVGYVANVQGQSRFTPGQEQSFHRQAAAALAHGEYDEAEELAASRPVDDPSAAALRARLQLLRGRYAEAEALVGAAALANPSSAAGLEFGLLLAATGRSAEAVDYLEAVVGAAARSPAALDLYRGGLAARACGRYGDANAFLRSAAAAAADDPAIQTAWAELFLEKYNQADAVRSFQEALTLDDNWAPAHLGLARAVADGNPPAARAAANRALEINPELVGAHLFVAELELGDRNTELARQSVDRALEINPGSLEARSLLTAMAYLEDRTSDFEAGVAQVLQINPTYGDVFRVAGSHAARAYRFDEAVSLVRRALDLNPNNPRALAELGMHLLRTGDEPGARRALERAFEDDPFDVVTFNLLNMMDTLDGFETLTRGDVIVRLHPDEVDVLGEYVLALAQQALDELSGRYRMRVEGPILVEVFPTHDDFAVRILGLPGMIGALGACFGRVVTMDSPRALPPGDFNWRSTLWHEMAHVITLQMSDQRVPRWLTEGISTYEEKRARPEWGRDQVLGFARALNEGTTLPLRELNSGFSRPETISMSYFQASILVEHIVEAYGEAALQDLVRAYADGVETEEALARIDLTFDTLQVSFDAAVAAEFGALQRALRPLDDAAESLSDPSVEDLQRLAAAHPDSYTVHYAYGASLYAAGEMEAARGPLDRAADLAPQATGLESPRGMLAQIAEELGDPERAMRELDRLLEFDATSIEAARKLAALAEAAGDEARMALAYDRIIGIDPFDAAPHRGSGRLALAAGDTDQAILEFKIALAAGAADRVAAYCDLAESYLRAGDFDAARHAVLNALEMAPTYERAQELLLRAIETPE